MMNKKTSVTHFMLYSSGKTASPVNSIDTSDIPDGVAGVKIGSAKDALERAKARRKQEKLNYQIPKI